MGDAIEVGVLTRRLAELRVPSLFLASDSCLDAGGSFDFSQVRCDFQQSHPYVTFDLWPFWAAFAGACTGVALVARPLAEVLIGDRKIETKITGVRPGEKIHEELFNPYERPEPGTPEDSLYRVALASSPVCCVANLRGPILFIHGDDDRNVDFAQTVSCYSADGAGRACGHCDACRLRADGFAAAGVSDPTRYL